MEELKNEKQELNRDEVTKVSGGGGGGSSAYTFTVTFAPGVSGKDCMSFVQAACRCIGSVTLNQGSKSGDGKRLMFVMTLAKNEPVTVVLSEPADRSCFGL